VILRGARYHPSGDRLKPLVKRLEAITATDLVDGLALSGLAVTVRRYHDRGCGGWWYFVPIANVVLLLEKRTEGENRFGPDPLLSGKSAESSGS